MTDIVYENWEPIIGLEIHVQLNTRSKLFSPAPNRFGDEPNINISDVCTGQPGTLPVLNREAVRKAVQFGCAVHAEIAPISRFDRKSYFYPDSPRNFQITQFESPIVLGGYVPADVDGKTKHFAIRSAHLEDDAGMLKHFTNFAGVDYNRAGVALLEIVSEPCIHSPKEASAYAIAVKAIMQYLGASDTNMEEGSLRMDVNVSVRLRGEKLLRNKVEIKNMNSFHYMEQAIEAEIKRQIIAYSLHPHQDPNEVVGRGTYRFDPDQKKTILMRQKEDAADYRYFPEPDLGPLMLTKAFVEEIRQALPELPHDRYKRYLDTLGLPPQAASHLINDKPLSDYFERAMEYTQHAKSLCNWLIVEFSGRLKEKGKSLPEWGISPAHVAALVNMVEDHSITGRIAKSVADDMLANPGKNPQEIVSGNADYQPISDSGTLEPLVDQVLAENPQSVADYQAGKTKAFAFLVGQVMKLCRGKASPDVVNALLKKKLL